MKNPNWTTDELKMAINIYCKIPFKNSRKTDPEIIRYAGIIGRSPGALYTKICNFGSFDKAMGNEGIKGLSHSGHLDKEIWDEFIDNPEQIIFESENLLAERTGTNIEDFSKIDTTSIPEGVDKYSWVKQRVGSSFFRNTVLNAYNKQCCITGQTCESLLEACHIVDWANDKKNRLNPHNGLCMNIMFHRAYDKNLISITPDYEIVISDKLIESFSNNVSFQNSIISLKGNKIHKPSKFLPDQDFLSIHYNQYLNAV